MIIFTRPTRFGVSCRDSGEFLRVLDPGTFTKAEATVPKAVETNSAKQSCCEMLAFSQRPLLIFSGTHSWLGVLAVFASCDVSFARCSA